jgi:hypothetical protein
MLLIPIMGPMTGDRNASGSLAFYFLTACVTLAVAFLSIWWQSRKLPHNTQSDRDIHDE